jgi:hypothetical protein
VQVGAHGNVVVDVLLAIGIAPVEALLRAGLKTACIVLTGGIGLGAGVRVGVRATGEVVRGDGMTGISSSRVTAVQAE